MNETLEELQEEAVELEEELQDDPLNDELEEVNDEVVIDMEGVDLEECVGEPVRSELARLKRRQINTKSVLVGDSIRMYMKEISRTPLLTAQEEVDLAMRIEAGHAAEELLEADRLADEDHKLPCKELRRLHKIEQDGADAKEHLAKANLRLVVSIAKKHCGHGLQLLDLIQEGNIGLLKAIDKFDYTKGFKFSTYATWWIRQAVTRSIADYGRSIRIPVHMVESINRIGAVERKLALKLGHEPNNEEIAQAIGYPVHRVENAKKYAQDISSLDMPVGDEDETHLGDFIEDSAATSPYQETLHSVLHDTVMNHLNILSDREKNVICLRFGIDVPSGPMTIENVANDLGIDRDRVRQLERSALNKLRRPSEAVKLRDFADNPSAIKWR